MSILKRGLTGAPVKRLQEKLGIGADGVFGAGTEQAVRDFQQSNGLAVDGIAGPDTFTAMGLHELVLLRVGSRGQAVKSLQEDLGIAADGVFGNGTKAALIAHQTASGLSPDGMAGPATLSSLSSFAGAITAETVKKAEVQADEQHFDSEPLPDLKGTEAIKTATATPAPDNSLWGKVKGWFS